MRVTKMIIKIKIIINNKSKTSKTLRLDPSKGSDPVVRVYKTTPTLHTSTSGPMYFLPGWWWM